MIRGEELHDHLEVALGKLRELVHSDSENISLQAAESLANICISIVNSFDAIKTDDSDDDDSE